MTENTLSQTKMSPLACEYLSNQLNDSNNQVYRRQGITAKGLDIAKSAVGFGKCKKNAIKTIQDFKDGKIDFQSADQYIKDYKYTQRDGSEIIFDTLTGAASFGIYSVSQKLIKFISPLIGENKVAKLITKNAKIPGIALAVLTGAITKPLLRFFDRIYLKRKEKRDNRTFGKDLLTGSINGAMAPVAMLKGAMLGVPLVLGENAIQRYLVVKSDDKKSIKDFINKQKDNIGLKAIGGCLLAYKAHKLDKSLKSWDKAISQALENVKNLKPFEKVETDSDFMELAKQAMGMVEPKFMEEIMSSGKTIEEKMNLIEAKNIFLPKFLQTIPENMLNMLSSFDGMEVMGIKLGNISDLATIVTRFKSNCPQSRTVEEAQQFISKTFGNKYTIIKDKALGVGTVAETFLAKDNTTGQEVVLKFLKKGMSLEKIENDRNVFIQALKAANKDNPEKSNFLVRKANSLFDAWAQEVDLSKEMEATQILGQNARNYNAVRAIEVKDNIYVMEKAPGVQFNDFIDDMMKRGKKISEQDMFKLMINYFQVFFEQLLSVPKKGMKVMHADPHPGNVFIDISNKRKPFTFIDTGNVLRYSPEEAIANALNHIDYLIGNTGGIAKALLRNASLPEGMTMEQAIKIVEKGLNERVYNGHSDIISGNFFENINNVGLKIMSENSIIPNQNNTNLLKAEVTYFSNLTCLKDIQKIIDTSGGHIKDVEAKQQMRILLDEIKHSLINSAINNKKATAKEIKQRVQFIDENKERFYSTIFSLVQSVK